MIDTLAWALYACWPLIILNLLFIDGKSQMCHQIQTDLPANRMEEIYLFKERLVNII